MDGFSSKTPDLTTSTLVDNTSSNFQNSAQELTETSPNDPLSNLPQSAPVSRSHSYGREIRSSTASPGPALPSTAPSTISTDSTERRRVRFAIPEESPNPTSYSPPASPFRSRVLSGGGYPRSEYSYRSGSSAGSTFSNPPARNYLLPGFGGMTDPRSVTESEKRTIIRALRTHQINTLTELRRIERVFALIGTPDVTEPMTTAWAYYVNSNTLLTELRSLTRNYPFSSDCLDEAKRRVYADPSSNRSWNFCWLVLIKVQTDQLIPYYAQCQAAQPAMWGGYTPNPEAIQQLADAFIAEWNYALGEMMRHWEQPPLAEGHPY